MAEWHVRSKRSPSGRLMKRLRKKRRGDKGLEFVETKLQKRKHKAHRSRGGTIKVKLLSEEKVNVADPKTRKIVQSTMLSVAENKANPHYVRRNILTKGAIVKTEAGLARITSRPGQDGVINAVLVKAK